MPENTTNGRYDLREVLTDLRSDVHTVRYRAIRMLAEAKDKRSTPYLVALLSHVGWSTEAAQALGEIGDIDAVPHLIRALEEGLKDEDDTLAGCAAEALGKLGDGTAIEALLQALHPSHLLEKVRQAVAAYTPTVNSYIYTGQLLCYVSYIRCAAAYALGQIGDVRAVTGLVEALNDPLDPPLRKAAAEALERFDTPEAKAAIQDWQSRAE